MLNLNPYASFDCLSIGARLQKHLENFAEAEIQLFAYLGCILSLYRQKPASDWEYKFAATKEGIPFSRELGEAIGHLSTAGFLNNQDDFYQLSERGLEELEFLRSLSQNSEREPFLEGACASLLAIPIGIVRDALISEPEIKQVIALSATRWLLEDAKQENLSEQFYQLKQAIGVESEDLMVPAVIWLTYLNRTSQAHSNF